MGELTVRKMIAELRKMPQGAKVAVCAHDQDPEVGEFDGAPNAVALAPESMRERGYGVIIYL